MTESYATTRVEILDFDAGTSISPIVRDVAPITYRRKEQAPVILPDGKCVIFGGSEIVNTIPVYIPEMFDPITENWQALPAASVPEGVSSGFLIVARRTSMDRLEAL